MSKSFHFEESVRDIKNVDNSVVLKSKKEDLKIKKDKKKKIRSLQKSF